ncbi:MAG: hypothetical protein IJ741_06455, partial [Schwartzia sp.]|nr:hypothetical protein [Schwartzia sp. (in: firmicutes)]
PEPISFASFTACTLYSWSYFFAVAISSPLLYFLFLAYKVSTIFIPHQFLQNRPETQKLYQVELLAFSLMYIFDEKEGSA